MNETKIYFEILQAKSDYSEEFTPLILTLFWDISFFMLTHVSVWQGKQTKNMISRIKETSTLS
jgi:hypothetical protein